MGFSSENGYVPDSIEDLMLSVMNNYNEQFSAAYTAETFLGTNAYKYFYSMVQRLQECQVKSSEIVLKIQDYFNVTNELITRPNTTAPGIIDYFNAFGYEASVKPPIDADAGKIYVCVNVDSGATDYAATKLEICNILNKCVVAGVISQGDQVEAITQSNDQSFDFKYYLPTETAILLRLTIHQSTNSREVALTDAEVTQLLFDNINARYKLGVDFEPQKYFSVVDAPWASTVLLEYSVNGGGAWLSTVHTASYRDLYTFELTDITVVNT